MKKVFLLIFCIVNVLSSQSQSLSRKQVDYEVEKHLQKGEIVSASNIIVDFAIEQQKIGDTATALEYQLKNLKLVEDNVDFFYQCGLTDEDYFANWYVSIILAQRLHKNDLAIQLLMPTLRKLQVKSPHLLPFYGSSLSFVLSDMANEEYRDSVFILQNVLNYISEQTPNQEILDQYMAVNRNFYINRFYDSYSGVIFVKDNLPIIRQWYQANKPFIANLDTNVYLSSIVEYELLFVQELMTYASTIGSQQSNYKKSIDLYKEAISILRPLVKLKPELSQKIASCQAQMASVYMQIGDFASCKSYSNEAVVSLNNHSDDLDYCSILETLAWTFYFTRNYTMASELCKQELLLHERLGWSLSYTDLAMYFLIENNVSPKEVIQIHQNIVVDGTPNFYYYLECGKAFSILSTDQAEYADSAIFYFNLVEKELSENPNTMGEKYISLYNSISDHYQRLNNWDAAYDYLLKTINFIDNDKLYGQLVLCASKLHDTNILHQYLPKFYQALKSEILKMIPELGSVEFESWSGFDNSMLYQLPIMAFENPSDTVVLHIAYNSLLLQKRLTMLYGSVASSVELDSVMEQSKKNLFNMRNDLYLVDDIVDRILALMEYQDSERSVLKEIIPKQFIANIGSVSESLSLGESSVEFMRFEGDHGIHYAALVYQKDENRVQFVDLFDESEIEEIYNTQPKSYEGESGQILYDKIWGRLDPYISASGKTFFSPIGLLSCMNIEVLSDDSGHLAIEKYHLHRVFSTGDIPKVDTIGNIKKVVCFGGIDYNEDGNVRRLRINEINTRGNLAYLKYSKIETDNIENIFSPSVKVDKFQGDKATEQQFRLLDGEDVKILHVASHGYYIPQLQRTSVCFFKNSPYTQYIPDNQFFSGLLFSGGDVIWSDSVFSLSPNDGILSSYEISQMDLRQVNLVVLSACQTALGDNLYDGIYGLQRAFKQAGVSSILMSLWEIEDKATSDFMTNFYKHLASGVSLNNAYISAVQFMKDKYPDPYYWASFILLE